MEHKELVESVKELRATAVKKKFVQSVDLIINLKELNLKKETDKVNSFIALPHNTGKRIKIAALVGEELSTKAKATCDAIILDEEFKSIDKKKIKKLARDMDYFIAQANIMPLVAGKFGKILGPRNKMPNPKAGGVIAPTAELKPVVERLQKTVKVETKNEPTIKIRVGIETSKDEELIENIQSAYASLLALLPQEKNNIKSVIIKTTMGKPIYVKEKKAATKEDKQ